MSTEVVRTLDGTAFSQVVRAGALAVMREQEALNRINVFPVRDADTGANLAATLKAAAARLGSVSSGGLGRAARAAADGALDGARGNSGAIVAQFFHGLAAGLHSRDEADGPQFAAAASQATDSAYSALQDPREGTILTVLRAWSHELGRRDQDEDFVEMMHRGLVAARKALAETPRQLEVLARNHVVDAGGQGFVFFLEGFAEALRGGHEVVWTPAAAPARGLPPFGDAHEAVDDRFRYCSEALLAPRPGQALDRAVVAAAVQDLGESLVVAACGVLEHTKVDDMVLQQLGTREGSIALVTDSTADLPGDEPFRLGLVAVPLTLSLGDDSYLDGVDITLQGFLDRIAASTAPPRSSQPAVADFMDTYRRLLEYREGIVSIHIAGAMSGTVQAASAAAREVDPERVRVVDSCTVSVGTGLLIQAVGKALTDGAGLDEAVALAEQVKRDIRVFGTVSSLDFAVRGGRVSPRMARTITRLGLAPIIVFDETGRPAKGGATLGFDRALNALVRRAARFAGDAPATAMVVHSGDEAGAAFVSARLEERFGAPVPVVGSGAVLTTHVGPGSVSVAVRRRVGV